MKDQRNEELRSRIEDRDYPPAPRYADRAEWKRPKPDEREQYSEYSGDRLRD